MVGNNLMATSAMYQVNATAEKVLNLIGKKLTTKAISEELGISRQAVYIYYGVLRREGFIVPRSTCPYEVTENGKNRIESSCGV